MNDVVKKVEAGAEIEIGRGGGKATVTEMGTETGIEIVIETGIEIETGRGIEREGGHGRDQGRDTGEGAKAEVVAGERVCLS